MKIKEMYSKRKIKSNYSSMIYTIINGELNSNPRPGSSMLSHVVSLLTLDKSFPSALTFERIIKEKMKIGA